MSFSAQPRPETPQHERASQGAIIVLATIPPQTHNGNTKVPNRSESNFPRTTPHTIDLVCPWWNNRYDEKAFSPARSIKTGGSQEYPPFIPIFSMMSVRRSLVQTKSGWWGRPRVVWYIGRIGALCCPCWSSVGSLSKAHLIPKSKRSRRGDTWFVGLLSSRPRLRNRPFVPITHIQVIPASFLSLNDILDAACL